MPQKVIFITGSSVGFGRALVEAILSEGDIAVATHRTPSALADLAEQHGPDRLLVLALDVTCQKQITEAFSAAIKAFGRVDVVINNAGSGIIGEVEGTDEEIGRFVFDVNVWGALEVSKQALELFRQAGPAVGGQLIQISSFLALSPFPGLGIYGASKAAFDGLSDALAAELSPDWNIKMTIVAPGAFETKIVTNAIIPPAHPAYVEKPSSGAHLARAYFAPGNLPGDPFKGAAAILALVRMVNPPTRTLMGSDALASWKRRLAAIQQVVAQSEETASATDKDPAAVPAST